MPTWPAGPASSTDREELGPIKSDSLDKKICTSRDLSHGSQKKMNYLHHLVTSTCQPLSPRTSKVLAEIPAAKLQYPPPSSPRAHNHLYMRWASQRLRGNQITQQIESHHLSVLRNLLFISLCLLTMNGRREGGGPAQCAQRLFRIRTRQHQSSQIAFCTAQWSSSAWTAIFIAVRSVHSCRPGCCPFESK